MNEHDTKVATTMQAVVRARYGTADVVTTTELPVPTIADDEILVRVHAASVNPADWHTMLGAPYVMRLQAGLRRPKQIRLGTDVAGVVVAIGRQVTEFAPGDAVWGGARGSYAEYAVAKEKSLMPQPDGVPFEETAAIPMAGLTALQGLRDRGGLVSGHRVLVIGASGGVGTYAVQIAKADGAEVTAVVSTRNVELVRDLGADHVVDYLTADFADTTDRYDVILDNVGDRSFAELRRIMAPSGTYVMVSGPKRKVLGPVPRMLRMMMISAIDRRRRLRPFLSTFRKADLEELGRLVRTGALRSVIDRRYPLAETAEALRHQGEGPTRGKIVIAVGDGGESPA